MDEQIDKDFRHVQQGKAARGLADFLGAELDRLDREADKRIYRLLMRNEAVDPQLALQVFLEKYAMHKLAQDLLKLMRAGESAGERISARGGE